MERTDGRSGLQHTESALGGVPSWWRTRPGLVLLGTSLLGFQGLTACEGTVSDGNGGPPATSQSDVPDAVGVTKTEPCFTAEQSFAWELYGPVFSRCIGCHNEFGLAREVGVGLRLTFPGEPEFAEQNVEVLSRYAPLVMPTDAGTLPLLLAKPTAQTEHIGGEVVKAGSPEARLLESFIQKLNNPPACRDLPADLAAEAVAGLVLAPPLQTYARAKFVLTGEVATPEELDLLPDSEEMLDQKLDELLSTEGFLSRVQEMFADWLLTEAYSSLVRGDDLLQQLRDYPQSSYYQPICTPERDFRCCDETEEICCVNVAADPTACTEQANDRAIDAVAREPLELIKHIVRKNLPMTELVTADYAVINPYSSIIYGYTEGQRVALFDQDPANDVSEFKAVPLVPLAGNELRNGPDGVYPHAGILSMPSLLVRYPSSTSNQQRTRGARLVLERLLAIPVMKLSDFSTAKLPPDADLELATQEYPACTVCHAAIDPIAGHFRSFGSSGQYRPDGRLPEHLPDPAFLNGEQAEEDDGDPLRWLGQQVAGHERFALGVLMPVLADLIGAEILTPPNDALSDGYTAKYLAFRIQQIEIQRLRREFAGPAALRLKPLVKAIVKGPFFRAIGAGELDEVTREALALAGVGPGTLLTPEQLARKIESATGFTYRDNLSPTGRDMFRSFRDYRLMFGGTDWDATAERYREPNAMAVRITLRMGNEMACLAVPQDFAIKDPAARKLFKNVAPSTTAESSIRSEIRRLHRLLLNEHLPDGHPELEATYQLWVESRAALDRDRDSSRLPSDCRATESYDTLETPYPTATHDAIEDDPDNTIRAWMAVVAYLLADGRFFLQ